MKDDEAYGLASRANAMAELHQKVIARIEHRIAMGRTFTYLRLPWGTVQGDIYRFTNGFIVRGPNVEVRCPSDFIVWAEGQDVYLSCKVWMLDKRYTA
jgi:hypothetical protein